MLHTEAPCWQIVVVLSGSMEPGFYRGDILFLYMSRSPVRTGEIVVFNLEGRDIPIVHRAVKVHERVAAGEINILTKGILNAPVSKAGLKQCELHNPCHHVRSICIWWLVKEDGPAIFWQQPKGFSKQPWECSRQQPHSSGEATSHACQKQSRPKAAIDHPPWGVPASHALSMPAGPSHIMITRLQAAMALAYTKMRPDISETTLQYHCAGAISGLRETYSKPVWCQSCSDATCS